MNMQLQPLTGKKSALQEKSPFAWFFTFILHVYCMFHVTDITGCARIPYKALNFPGFFNPNHFLLAFPIRLCVRERTLHLCLPLQKSIGDWKAFQPFKPLCLAIGEWIANEWRSFQVTIGWNIIPVAGCDRLGSQVYLRLMQLSEINDSHDEPTHFPPCIYFPH